MKLFISSLTFFFQYKDLSTMLAYDMLNGYLEILASTSWHRIGIGTGIDFQIYTFSFRQ